MVPKYKLTYFDLAGLGEPIRYLLSYGGLEFEDNRVPKENWPTFKPTVPLGQLPILEFDGKVLYQSTPIARYLGNVVGLAGKTLLENWEIDAVAETITDFRIKVAAWKFEQNEARQETLKKQLVQELVPFYLSKFEERAKQNGGYLAIGRLTWVDLLFVAIEGYFSGWFNEIGVTLLSGYPNLKALEERVLSLPQIKAWNEKRAQCN